MAAEATSRGSPSRFIGMASNIDFLAGDPIGLFRLNISVSIGPGATQLTVMEEGASSIAQDFVNPTRPALAAA